MHETPETMTDAPSVAEDLRAFGFEGADERWLSLTREAQAPLARGRIGAYELMEEVGRGGQGLVFRAIHVASGRPIAIKRLLGGGLATASMRRRFEREFEALAALDHPNIVAVFGTELVDGVPILAMQWIDGVPINHWAARGANGPLPVRGVVELILRVCDAVLHAHQRGVLHRDLKPSNILIDERGEPHVLDFGLARLTPALEGPSSLSMTEHFVGTLDYASPEQLAGRTGELDARSDIYSLGVILFDMVTGRLPFGKRGDSSGAPAAGRTAPLRPTAISPRVDAGLEAILLKALAERPRDRYQSVESFAADLGNWMAGGPISARPWTGWDGVMRMARQHRTAAAFILTIVALIAAGGAVAAALAARLAHERDVAVVAQENELEARRHAQEEAAKAQAVARFLQDMLSQADPMSGRPRAPALREVLDEASKRVESDSAIMPEVAAATHKVLGATYHSRGEHDPAEAHLRRAVELQRTLHADDAPEKAAALHELGHLLTSRGRYEEAEGLLREALRMRRATLGEQHLDVAESMNHLAKLLHLRERFVEAEPLWRGSLDIRRAQLGDKHPLVASSLANLGMTRRALGDSEQANALLRQSLETSRAALGTDHPDVAFTLHNLGLVRRDAGDLAEAESLFNESLRIKRLTLEENHPAVGFTLQQLGELYAAQGDDARAEPLFLQTLAIYEKAMEPTHPRTQTLIRSLSDLYSRLGQPDKAEALASRFLTHRPPEKTPG